MVKVSPSTKKESAGTKPFSPVSVGSLKNLVMVFKAPKTTEMFIQEDDMQNVCVNKNNGII